MLPRLCDNMDIHHDPMHAQFIVLPYNAREAWLRRAGGMPIIFGGTEMQMFLILTDGVVTGCTLPVLQLDNMFFYFILYIYIVAHEGDFIVPKKKEKKIDCDVAAWNAMRLT